MYTPDSRITMPDGSTRRAEPLEEWSNIPQSGRWTSDLERRMKSTLPPEVIDALTPEQTQQVLGNLAAQSLGVEQ